MKGGQINTFARRVKMAGKREPPRCWEAVRAEADSLVEEWWRRAGALALAHQPSRPVPMSAPSEHSPLVAPWLGDFDARAYGMDYIGLGRGDTVVLLEPSAGDAADVQWTHGKVGDSRGWFLTAYVVQSLCEVSTPSEEPMAYASTPHGPALHATLVWLQQRWWNHSLPRL